MKRRWIELADTAVIKHWHCNIFLFAGESRRMLARFQPSAEFFGCQSEALGPTVWEKAAGNALKGLGRRRVVKGWRCRSLIKRALGISALWTCRGAAAFDCRLEEGGTAAGGLEERCAPGGWVCGGGGGHCIVSAVLSEICHISGDSWFQIYPLSLWQLLWRL